MKCFDFSFAALVPDNVKKELLQRIRTFLAQQSDNWSWIWSFQKCCMIVLGTWYTINIINIDTSPSFDEAHRINCSSVKHWVLYRETDAYPFCDCVYYSFIFIYMQDNVMIQCIGIPDVYISNLKFFNHRVMTLCHFNVHYLRNRFMI